MHEETQGDAIVATGVGQHQMWAAQWYLFDQPRRWLTSGGLGSMGFGLPSALGAAVAYDGTDGRPKKVGILFCFFGCSAGSAVPLTTSVTGAGVAKCRFARRILG
jgi:hypothetical protein